MSSKNISNAIPKRTAIASLVKEDELHADYIIPSALNKEGGAVVAKAVAQAARDSGVARI